MLSDPEDYAEINQSNNPLESFNDTTRRQCFNVSIREDAQSEGREDFSFELRLRQQNLVILVSPNVSVVVIQDDDSMLIMCRHLSPTYMHISTTVSVVY